MSIIVFKALPRKDLQDRHLSTSGQCCLWLRPKSPWNASDPNALRDFLLQLVVFFDRQLIYDLTEVWPGPAYRHERDGYLEFIQEEMGPDAYLFPFLLSAITKPGSVARNDSCLCTKRQSVSVAPASISTRSRRVHSGPCSSGAQR